MAQVMLYLDEETEQAMRKAAERAGLPYSRWVAGSYFFRGEGQPITI